MSSILMISCLFKTRQVDCGGLSDVIIPWSWSVIRDSRRSIGKALLEGLMPFLYVPEKRHGIVPKIFEKASKIRVILPFLSLLFLSASDPLFSLVVGNAGCSCFVHLALGGILDVDLPLHLHKYLIFLAS